MKYKYFNPDKLEMAQKVVKERIAAIIKAIPAKEALLENAEKAEASKLKEEIKILKEQLSQEEELVLAEYLNLCGRVEDEDGNKILTKCDRIIGEEKVAEMERRKKLAKSDKK